MTCARTQEFLAKRAVVYKERVDAGKARFGAGEALKLARQASKVIVAKGKKVVVFDMKKAPPDDESLLAAMLGPTGNLRAPTLRRGATLLVGFEEGTYKEIFD